MADDDLPDWAKDAAPAPNSPPASSAAHDDDASLPSWVADANKPAAPHGQKHTAPHAAPGSGPAAVPAAPQTRFQQAGTPAPANEPEPSWGDVGQAALHNLLPSAAGAGQAMWHAIRYAPETVSAIGQLGRGLGSQALGAMGEQQDPQEKARTEALAKAMEDHYASTYGSVRGFKKAVSEDPASVLMDASTALSGGAGVMGKIAGLEKAAGVVGKVASAIDPAANAVRVAKVALKPVAGAVRAASSVGTGVPADLLKVAAKAGSTTDPVLRNAFLKFYRGQGDPAEFLSKAQSALGQIRQDASDAYLAKRGALANANPSFQPIDDAIAAARAQTRAGGINVGQFQKANDALDQAESMVNGWKAAPDPAYRSLQGFDNLKQALWDMRDNIGNDVAQRHLASIYHGTKQAITDVDPAYADLMEQYQLGRNQIMDMQKSLVGAGANPAATTAMAKSLRALKTPTGKNIFAQLAAKEPELPFMLAGNALHPWGAGGKAGLFEAMQGLPLAGMTAWMTHNPLLGAGQFAAQAALQSPKIAGALNFGAGALGRAAGTIAKSAYYPGRIEEEGAAEATPGSNLLPAEEADPTFRAMLGQESGNHQFKPDGSTVTSIKGATGAAQIMPATGPEAAALAGLPWDPERLKTDADYNRALGHAYFKHQIDTFGDEAKAVAAYNAGPGAVRLAVAKANALGDSWLNHVPLETKRYVNAVLAGRSRLYRASGGRVDHGKRDELVDKLLKGAEAAKRVGKKVTEPLLNASDDAVAKALAVAQRAI